MLLFAIQSILAVQIDKYWILRLKTKYIAGEYILQNFWMDIYQGKVSPTFQSLLNKSGYFLCLRILTFFQLFSY